MWAGPIFFGAGSKKFRLAQESFWAGLRYFRADSRYSKGLGKPKILSTTRVWGGGIDSLPFFLVRVVIKSEVLKKEYFST